MATAEQAVNILNALVKKLGERQQDSRAEYGVETLSNAYRGDFKLRFASNDFRDYFAERYSQFSDNWCGIVADAPHERLEPIGIRVGDEAEGDKGLWTTWLRNDADALCDLALLDAIVAKRSYALVWGDADDNATIQWEHPSQAIVGYDPETRARVSGAKVWCDDGFEYATLYLPDEVWKFQRKRTESVLSLPQSMTEGPWRLRGEGRIPNPLGKVPLVEVPNRPQLMGEPRSDIAGTLAMQHAINLLWAQLFAVADDATLAQRIVLGAEQPVMPVLNDAGEVIGEKPVDMKKLRSDRTLWIEDPQAKIGEWSPANLKVFTDIIEIAVGHIAAQTRTPAHYLLIGGTVANVSGDAMQAFETGLVMRTKEKAQHFGRAIRDVFELVALAEGDAGKADSIRTSGKVVWADIENRSEAQRADALSKKKDIGYPLAYLLELDGLPPQEIERVLGMVEAEQLDPLTNEIIAGLGNGDAPVG